MLATPGILPLWLTSIVGRLPNGALTVLLVLRTREMTGSYAAGGVAAAAFGIAGGVSQPPLGRLIDRRGQALVIVPAALAAGVLLATFAALPDAAPLGLIVTIAAAAGLSTPPINSCLRALLFAAVPPAERHRAFTFDSTLFELIYITGPLVIVGVVGAASLRAAVATCAVLSATGGMLFATTTLSRNARGGAVTATDWAGPLRDGSFRTLLVGVALFALSIANLEVGMAAFATDHGHRSAVGYLLALSGAGSLTGGLVAGRLPAPTDPERRLVGLLVALTVLEVPLALMPSLPAMAVAITVAGVSIAPSLAVTYQLATERAPDGTVTEALTWMNSAILAGIALGSALAGALVDGPGTTYALAAISVFTAVETAWLAARI